MRETSEADNLLTLWPCLPSFSFGELLPTVQTLPIGSVLSHLAATEYNFASVCLLAQFAVPYQPVDDRTEGAVLAGGTLGSLIHGDSCTLKVAMERRDGS